MDAILKYFYIVYDFNVQFKKNVYKFYFQY